MDFVSNLITSRKELNKINNYLANLILENFDGCNNDNATVAELKNTSITIPFKDLISNYKKINKILELLDTDSEE